jgi:hypothetical protein
MEGKVVESMFRMLLMGMSIEQLADGGNCHSNSRIISVKAHKESTPIEDPDMRGRTWL